MAVKKYFHLKIDLSSLKLDLSLMKGGVYDFQSNDINVTDQRRAADVLQPYRQTSSFRFELLKKTSQSKPNLKIYSNALTF